MQIVKEEFVTTYSIKGGLVRSSASGNFQGNDYDPSVRITCTNQYEVENSKTEFEDDIEQRVVFKIICPDNATAGKVASSIKQKLRNGSINFSGGLPNDNKIVNVITPYDTFLSDVAPIKQTEFNSEKSSKK